MSSAAEAYLAEASRRLASVRTGQEDAFAAAIEAMQRAAAGDRLIYLFGTGHSHMLAEEGHYRAGGLACIVPVLSATVMLYEGAVAGSRLERTSGLADIVLSRYAIGAGDVLVVFSNSGGNAVPVEAARVGDGHPGLEDRRPADEGLASDRAGFLGRRRGIAARPAGLGWVCRRLDPVTGAAGTSFDVPDRRGFLVALDLRRDWIGT